MTPFKFTTEAAAIVEIERLEHELTAALAKSAPIQDQLAMQLMKHGINLKAIGGAGKEGQPGGGEKPKMNATEICEAVNAGTLSKEQGIAMSLAHVKGGEEKLTKLAYVPLAPPPSCT